MFMTTEEAAEIVYNLAQGNALESYDCDTEELQHEYLRQQAALDVIHDFFINVIYA